MQREALLFDRPQELFASRPPEMRGEGRDDVRLLVSSQTGHTHARFVDLPKFLRRGDLLVVNESATLPASLHATGRLGPFVLNLSTRFDDSLWLAEPRWDTAKQGPLPIEAGEVASAGAMRVKFLAPCSGIPRLWFVRADGSLLSELATSGAPIRYGYVNEQFPMGVYQTMFSRVPGSAEMPSAARPITPRVLRALSVAGIRTAHVLLHTGVSSLEIEAAEVERQALYPEPFAVPSETARAVNETRERGGRVIAVGTTVVRALESAWTPGGVRPASGFTRVFVHPGTGVHAIDGLLTGLHDPVTSHLAMLSALAGRELVFDAYREAIERRYLWHEFGDSHLIVPPRSRLAGGPAS
jgi:S-adenosylmethionine:tRNA ribosyltransferase-isomerase